MIDPARIPQFKPGQEIYSSTEYSFKIGGFRPGTYRFISGSELGMFLYSDDHGIRFVYGYGLTQHHETMAEAQRQALRLNDHRAAEVARYGPKPKPEFEERDDKLFVRDPGSDSWREATEVEKNAYTSGYRADKE